mgnify:CR=1
MKGVAGAGMELVEITFDKVVHEDDMGLTSVNKRTTKVCLVIYSRLLD